MADDRWPKDQRESAIGHRPSVIGHRSSAIGHRPSPKAKQGVPMSGTWQYALTVGPLGFYLWVLALWQSGRHPRVVSGLVDHALLVFGVGGIIVFGPFGQLLARMIFGRPDVSDWVVIGAVLGLWATLVARRAL